MNDAPSPTRVTPLPPESLAYDERGLVAGVVQHADTGAVLMLGWMSQEAVAATLATGQVHFHSRSRGRLWRKGETSGNTLELVGLTADCDGDAVLVTARPAGPTCHTGEASCFHRPMAGESAAEGLSLAPLLAVVRRRLEERPEGSYTAVLAAQPDRLLKKLVEEAAEVALAVKNRDRENLVWELADLFYHATVTMAVGGVTPAEVSRELARRAGGGAS